MARRRRRRQNAENDLGLTGPVPVSEPEIVDEEVTPVARQTPLSAENLVDLVQDYSEAITSTLEARTPLEQKWLHWNRVYRADKKFAIKNYPYQGSANITVALAAMFVDQIVARIMQSIFPIEPHWSATQRNKTYAKYAKPLEQYLDFVRTDVWDQYAVVKSFVLEVVKFGTGIIYQGWLDDAVYRWDSATQTTVLASRFVGPAPRWVPREDFLMPVGFAEIQSAPWVGEREWFSEERLMALQRNGVVQNVDLLNGEYDDESQLRIESRKTHESAQDSAGSPVKTGLYACWRVWFSRDLDGDGYPEQYCMLIHPPTKTLLYAHANPFTSAMRPYVSARFVEVEGEFDGIGVCEQTEDAQAEVSTIHNQRRDNATMCNMRMYKGRRGAGLPDSIRAQNGKVILMSDITDIQEWKLVDNRQVDAFEENITIQSAKERVGMTDMGSGNITSPMGRAAATTTMAVMQESARRFDLNVSEIRRALSEQGQQIIDLYQTYGVPAPNMPGSPESVLDPEPAALVREILGTQDNLRGLVRIKLNASTAAVNREIEKQSTIQLYGLVSQYAQQQTQLMGAIGNPQVPPGVREALIRASQGMDRMMSRVFQAHNAFDLESVLVGDIVAQMAAQPQPMVQPGMAQPGAPIPATGQEPAADATAIQ